MAVDKPPRAIMAFVIVVCLKFDNLFNAGNIIFINNKNAKPNKGIVVMAAGCFSINNAATVNTPADIAINNDNCLPVFISFLPIPLFASLYEKLTPRINPNNNIPNTVTPSINLGYIVNNNPPSNNVAADIFINVANSAAPTNDCLAPCTNFLYINEVPVTNANIIPVNSSISNIFIYFIKRPAANNTEPDINTN